MKIAVTDWFKPIVAGTTVVPMQNYQVTGSDWDVLAVQFQDTDFDSHLRVITNLRSRTKKLIVVETEPISNKHAKLSFVEISQKISARDVVLYSDCIFNSDTAQTKTAISWFVSNENYYQATSENWKHWSSKMLSGLDHRSMQRPRYWECLLGTQRIHRDMVADFWARSPQRNKFVFSYFRDKINRGIWSYGIDVSNLTYTANFVTYLGSQVPLSAILPVEIYNNTYYSLVAETTCDNAYSHFTEKIVKPILARRPFVVIAGQGYLKNLRRLGFQTFDACGIDESYDDIVDTEQRIVAAWREIESLCHRDPQQVYRDTALQRQHNFQHFVNTDWYSDLRGEFR